nr:MAG TPA: hypothetical protein [Caudoviricetes sp.]
MKILRIIRTKLIKFYLIIILGIVHRIRALLMMKIIYF